MCRRIAFAAAALLLAMPGPSLLHAAPRLAPMALPDSARAPVLRVDQKMDAAADATDFLFQLSLLEGHLMIGKELADAGQDSLALPHFGHPVREIYDDISPYLDSNHIAPFDADLIRLEAAIAKAPRAPETVALFNKAIDDVHRARATTPQALRDTIPEMIRICSDTIEAAAGDFGESLDRGRIEQIVEYHDSRGYLRYTQLEADRMAALAKTPEEKGLVARFKAVLAKAWWIVDPLIPDPAPRASVAQYRAVAAEAAALVKK